MAPHSDAMTEDLTNMIMFCRKTAEPFVFREPVSGDFLGSQVREEHLLPRHEIVAAQFTGRPGELITQKTTAHMRASQKRSARSHWHTMRTVIPDLVWENW